MDNYFIKVTDKKLIKTICDLLEAKGWKIDDGLRRSEVGHIAALRVPKKKGFVSGSGSVGLYENSTTHKGTFISIEQLLGHIEHGDINYVAKPTRVYWWGQSPYYGHDRNFDGAEFIAITANGTAWAVDDESCGDLQKFQDKYCQGVKILGVYKKLKG